jgi:hypothetical protein
VRKEDGGEGADSRYINLQTVGSHKIIELFFLASDMFLASEPEGDCKFVIQLIRVKCPKFKLTYVKSKHIRVIMSPGIQGRVIRLIFTHVSKESTAYIVNIVAYRPVARQRPRSKQRDKCSVYSRCYAIGEQTTLLRNPFLSNGSVNTFPRQRIRKH